MADAAVHRIEFVDLQAQRRRLGTRIDEAIGRVLDHGGFIMGPEVAELEARLADFSGAEHVISCSNGTAALELALRALDIGPGDAVFVPTFTFASTAEAVALVGATPVFVDVLEDTFNLDVRSLERAIADVRTADSLHPAAVIAVDLFGQPADYDAIGAVADGAGLAVIGDAAQSFGATWAGRRVGTLARITTTSFFPAKPLGCYGDGGALFTDDEDIAGRLRSLRVHGKGADKYDNVRIGINGRLDTIQAAILLEKLEIFSDEIESRNAAASVYGRLLAQNVTTPIVASGATSVWAQYTVRVPHRSEVIERMRSAGVPTAVYYPLPLHRQTAYAQFPTASSGLATSERLATDVLSLPMHPYLDEATQAAVTAALLAAVMDE